MKFKFSSRYKWKRLDLLYLRSKRKKKPILFEIKSPGSLLESGLSIPAGFVLASRTL